MVTTSTPANATSAYQPLSSAPPSGKASANYSEADTLVVYPSESIETFAEKARRVDHGDLLSAGIQRMYQNEVGLDCILISSDGKSLPVHTIVLATFSTTFAQKMASARKEAIPTRVQPYVSPVGASQKLTGREPRSEEFGLRVDVDYDSLRRLVAYAYTGNVHLDPACVLKTLDGARVMGMESAVQVMSEWLVNRLTVENALRVWYATRQLTGRSARKLLRTIDAFVCDYFCVITMLDGWMQLPGTMLQRWLVMDDLLIPSEYRIVQAISRWVSEKTPDGSRFLASPYTGFASRAVLFSTLVSSCVRFCYLTDAELHMIESHPMVVGEERMAESAVLACVVAERRRRELVKNAVARRSSSSRSSAEGRVRREFNIDESGAEGSFASAANAALEGALDAAQSANDAEAEALLSQGIVAPRRYTDAAVAARAASTASLSAGSARDKRSLDVVAWFDFGVCVKARESLESLAPDARAPWSADAPLVELRGEFAVAAVGDAVLLFAGCNDAKSLLSVECRIPASALQQGKEAEGKEAEGKEVEGKEASAKETKMDEEKRYEWREVSQMSSARIDPAACTLDVCDVEGVCCHGSAVMIAGGCSSTGEVLKSVDVFAAATGAWSSLPDMLECRSSFGACSGRGRVFVVGGANNASSALASCEAYDPWSGDWTKMPALKRARWALSAIVVKGALYAIGGVDASESVLATVETMSVRASAWDDAPGSRTWTETASLSTPRHSFGVAASGGKIYVVGGRDAGGNDLDSIEVYDPCRGYWVEVTRRLSTARSSLKCVAVGGSILAIGGCSGTEWLRTVERLDVAPPALLPPAQQK